MYIEHIAIGYSIKLIYTWFVIIHIIMVYIAQ